MFVPESLKKQNELIGTLRKQLEATEQELASQKWLLSQYLQSPSWKVTAPLRWVMRKLRSVKQAVSGSATDSSSSEMISPPTQPQRSAADHYSDPRTAETAYSDLKQMYASLDRIALETFLASDATLELPAAATPDVSIIVVLFNRAELTFQCLRSIRENFDVAVEVIIADNASTDRTPDLLERIRGARIIRNAENRHFLQAVNEAAREARGTHLLLLNNDAQLLPGSLKAALETIGTDDMIGAVGGRIIRMDGSLQEAGSIIWRDGSCLGYGRDDNPFSSPYMFRRDVDYCSGAFLLTPRKVWEGLGGFDERFKPAYYEETDYCMRLWERKLRVVYDPFAAILHHEFASSASSANAIALQAEHQGLFAKRHAKRLQQHLDSSAEVLVARLHRREPPLQRLLFIDDQVPHRSLGSGFPRARTVLLSLLERGYFLTVFPMVVLDEEWSSVYSDVPRDVEVINDMGLPLLEAFLRNRKRYYDAIVVSRPHNMKLFQAVVNAYPEWFKDTAIVYDAEAFLAPREIGLRELNGMRPEAAEIERTYRDEAALAASADCVVAVSEMDRTLFRQYGVGHVHLLGHTLEIEATGRAFQDRHGFLFIGAIHEETSPNADSMIWFLSEVWPIIRRRLGERAELIMAGINRSDRVKSLAGPGVRIIGRVDDLSLQYERARVFIAPTRFAAGIPHKVHEAAAHGLPVVATPILAEQLDWRDGLQIAVGGTAAEFAERCIELHESPQAWLKLRDAALDAVAQECSAKEFEERISEILRCAGLETAAQTAAQLTPALENRY